ncbi:alpha/beta hydrolase [Neobacillus sp. MER 74]|uniref:alpha/beta fold hydrolase n=1 Tax=Neobacillus sp. MER 74 TaxID=2939566 RepID=UPI00203BA584|nr:alpha/beta hydrolase [Neobacillus sp. MER 74]MCM3113742.1 alpha/beta hydrolase [Neobacillus sp. MER 74]
MFHYLDMGKGEPLVLIHGFGSKKESWKNQYELSESYRLIIPDLLGHGESNDVENISIPNFAKNIISLLDQLGIESAHFCGISLGGIIVQEIYKLFPKRVRSMILSNTTSYLPKTGAKWILKKKIDQFLSAPRENIVSAAASNCLYDQNPEFIQEVKDALLLKDETYIKTAKATIGVNYLFMLPFIKVPTLIIGGLYDKLLPVILARQTHLMTLGKAKLVILDECGHAPIIECKERYNELLLEFLNEQSQIYEQVI